MVRIVAGGDGFADYVNNDFVDRYVKIVFPAAGRRLRRSRWTCGPSARPCRASSGRSRGPTRSAGWTRWPGNWPSTLWSTATKGLAGPWAATAQPGDTLTFTGPGGGYNPAPGRRLVPVRRRRGRAAGHRRVHRVPAAEAPGLAFLEVDSDADIQPIAAPAGVELPGFAATASPQATATCWSQAVADADWPAGRVDVFAHGERGYMKGLRDVFFVQRGLDRKQVSLSGYWAEGRVEDDFQAEKKLPVGQI